MSYGTPAKPKIIFNQKDLPSPPSFTKTSNAWPLKLGWHIHRLCTGFARAKILHVLWPLIQMGIHETFMVIMVGWWSVGLCSKCFSWFAVGWNPLIIAETTLIWSWKTWKVREFSRPEKSRNFDLGRGKIWKMKMTV